MGGSPLGGVGGGPTCAERCSVPLQWQRPSGTSYQALLAQLTQPQSPHAFHSSVGIQHHEVICVLAMVDSKATKASC